MGLLDNDRSFDDPVLAMAAGLLGAPSLGIGMQRGLLGGMQAEQARNSLLRQQRADALAERKFGLEQSLFDLKKTEAQRKSAQDETLQSIVKRLMGPQQSAFPDAGSFVRANAQITGVPSSADNRYAGIDAPAPSHSGGTPGGGFPLSLTDVTALRMAGGPDLLEHFKYATTPQKREGGAFYDNPLTGRREFIDRVPEGMRPAGTGFAAIPGYGETNARTKGMETAAVETERARLDPFKYLGPDGNEYTTSRLSGLGGQMPQFPSRLPQVPSNLPAPGMPPGFPQPSSTPGSQPAQFPGGVRTGVNPADRAQSEKIATQFGEYYSQMQSAGLEAAGQLSRLERAVKLLENSGGGRWSPGLREAASIANTFGIRLDPKLGDKQAGEALAIEIANAMRRPGTGPMTDRDFENFKAAVPDLAKTPEGRQRIFETARGFLERSRQEANMARQYRQRYGRIDENFFNQLESWRDRNPVFRQPENRAGATGEF